MFTSKQISYGVTAFIGVILLSLAGMLFETNNSGFYAVKQAAGTGNMSVRFEPGVFPQMFADITSYKISDVYEFKDDTAISVRFNDAATAQVSGQIKFKLSMVEKDALALHQDFRSFEAVENDLVRQVVAASIKQSATMFGAEEVYSTRRSDFINLITNQVKDGIYATTFSESYQKDEDGSVFLKRFFKLQLDQAGKPIIAEPSAFNRYHIEVIQLVINNIDFDEKTNELIAKRKEAEQEKVVAKAKAERAKQDAITAQEQGKANVALAEAEALVIKKKAVIEAEKAKEVAAQQALQAEEEKKAIIARGEAEAKAAALKVAAGLTPLEKAKIDKETAIGVAAEIAKVKLPTTMVIGQGAGGTQVNPFDAVGLESFMRISKNMAEENAN